MQTKLLIRDQGRDLFNQYGVMNITLRDVAKRIEKSYGNVTYHYPHKQDLILALYQDMSTELTALQQPKVGDDLLAYFLQLPSLSYSIATKYLFLSLDIIEIKRNFTKVFTEIAKDTEQRKVKWLHLLQALNQQGYFRDDMTDQELHYIMLLSGSIRTAYFQTLPSQSYNEKEYSQMVNMLLKPYLSKAGLKVYEEALST